MTKLLTFCVVLAFCLPAVAVQDGEVMYAGGTVPGLSSGVVGHLDLSFETSLAFEYTGSRLTIPYAAIDSFQYSQEVKRHLGVLPAIAIGLVKQRQHRHFFRITYRGEGGTAQVAIFEVTKSMPRSLNAILETRVPKPCKLHAPCVAQR